MSIHPALRARKTKIGEQWVEFGKKKSRTRRGGGGGGTPGFGLSFIAQKGGM